jgi:hypothetical protein
LHDFPFSHPRASYIQNSDKGQKAKKWNTCGDCGLTKLWGARYKEQGGCGVGCPIGVKGRCATYIGWGRGGRIRDEEEKLILKNHKIEIREEWRGRIFHVGH